ncbi:hypothetical protein [Leuconostoc falkenbergense]|uniref:hypothetical protein n=1 Tax=Leuconostoc falkenbergense TaxID=2766470 RepID=UPI0029589B4D|nr:hypothetical protein [Leuconostoc falkenbergense]MDV8951300.1 hypothetical protein [Leuconostoc falkenbergense]
MKILTEKFVDALIIKKARNGLSAKELSNISGVNRVTISLIINKKTSTAQEKTFDKLNDWLLSEDK